MSLTSLKQMASSNKVCRICHEIEFVDEQLLAPCACNGSIKFVHNSCLHEWFRTQHGFEHPDTWRCEVCSEKFTWNFDTLSRQNCTFYMFLKDYVLRKKDCFFGFLNATCNQHLNPIILLMYFHIQTKFALWFSSISPTNYHDAVLEAFDRSSFDQCSAVDVCGTTVIVLFLFVGMWCMFEVSIQSKNRLVKRVFLCYK